MKKFVTVYFMGKTIETWVDVDELNPGEENADEELQIIGQIKNEIQGLFQEIHDMMSGEYHSAEVLIRKEGIDLGSFDTPGWLYKCSRCAMNFPHPPSEELAVCPGCRSVVCE